MRLEKSILGMVFMLGVANAYAEDYTTEVGLDYIDVGDTEIGRIFGRYHFNEVNTDDVPLAEAGFLGRSSNIFASYSHASSGLGSFNSLLGADYYKNNFFVSAFFFSQELGRDNIGFDETRSTLFATELGYMPIDGLRISTIGSTQGYDPNVIVKYVKPLGNDTAVNLTADFFDQDGGNSFSVGGDYYFNNRTSVGFGYGENGDISNTSFKVGHFFTPKFNMNIELANSDRPNDDETIFGLGVGFRF